MTKKIGIVFCLFIIGMVMMSVQLGTNRNIKTSTKTDKNVIENINKVALSKTNYEYSEEIKGYKYEPVELSSSAIELIKQELTGLKLDNNASGVVYGKYKLELDDNIIYFDLNNDIALLKNKNYVIKLNNSFKKQLLKSDETCSCCEDTNCLINLCKCENSNYE